MPIEFRYTPTVTHKKEKVAIVIALTVAAVALVLRATDVLRLLSQLLFILSASVAIFLYVRYFHYTYTYRLTEDALLEVVRTDGKRISVLLSVPLSSVAEYRVIPYREKPKKAFSFLPALLPPAVCAVKLSGGTENCHILLDATPDFVNELRICVHAAKFALHTDGDEASEIDTIH